MPSVSQRSHDKDSFAAERHTHPITSSAGRHVTVFGHFYFFLPESKVGCHAAAFRLGAAAFILIFSFFGFLASRLLLCWPFAMSISLGFAECRIGLFVISRHRRAQAGEACRDHMWS